VSIQRWAFMKDVGFYLMALLMIAAILKDGKVGAQGKLADTAPCLQDSAGQLAGQCRTRLQAEQRTLRVCHAYWGQSNGLNALHANAAVAGCDVGGCLYGLYVRRVCVRHILGQQA
jgi:hypothetical protein